MEALNFNTLITLGIYLLTGSALYWRMRINIAEINAKIAEILCDRKEKWDKHDEKQDKSDAVLTDILRGIGEIRQDTREFKTNIDWLIKNNDKK